jgi:hypothetical protein
MPCVSRLAEVVLGEHEGCWWQVGQVAMPISSRFTVSVFGGLQLYGSLARIFDGTSFFVS